MTAVLLGFLLALAESGLGLGAVLPGELAISALAAAAGPLTVPALGLAVALGATAGDHVGYLVGRHGGTHLRETRLVARLGVQRWDRASRFMQRHGFWAVLASRLLPVVRTVMPVVAGTARMRYPLFLVASLCGAVLWSTLWVGAGAGAGTAVVHHPWLLAGAGALLLGIAVLVRRRTASDTTAEAPPTTKGPSHEDIHPQPCPCRGGSADRPLPGTDGGPARVVVEAPLNPSGPP